MQKPAVAPQARRGVVNHRGPIELGSLRYILALGLVGRGRNPGLSAWALVLPHRSSVVGPGETRTVSQKASWGPSPRLLEGRWAHPWHLDSQIADTKLLHFAHFLCNTGPVACPLNSSLPVYNTEKMRFCLSGS